MPAHLNRKQQREIKAVVERAKKDNGIPQTAQQSIPFQRMFPDGICRVTDNYYTKTIQYQDINYQLHKFHGQVVKISSSSTNYINPMDININYSEDDNPVALKADFILSLCELIVGSKDGLQPVEKTVIDRCVHQIYQRYFDDPKPENMPILLWE